jgi:hypothetical protein
VIVALVCLALALSGSAVAAGEKKKDEPNEESLAKALKKGKYKVGLRYRLETVDDDNPQFGGEDGEASTLRTTLAYTSAKWADLRLFLEFEDVSDLGLEDDHNNAGRAGLGNGVNRPVVADPALTEMNQLTLQYTGIDKTALTAGRQEIALGDQRFVGPVGWRQNHQSLDAFRATTKAVPRTELTYIYIDQVNRIFGDNQHTTSHLLDAKIHITENWGHVAPYYYRLDYDDAALAGLSTDTLGVAWFGTCTAFADSGWTFPFRVEAAQQEEGDDNPNEVDAGYFRVELGGARPHWWVKAGYELLEGEPGEGSFNTPLATLHKFNGWADKFLGTPATGLEDTWIGFGGSTDNGFSGGVYYHEFTSDSMSLDYGDELNAVLSYKASWKQVFALKYASYNADDFSADTDKFWFWTSYSFGS